MLLEANFLNLCLLVQWYEILAIKRILNGVDILSLKHVAFFHDNFEAIMVIILI